MMEADAVAVAEKQWALPRPAVVGANAAARGPWLRRPLSPAEALPQAAPWGLMGDSRTGYEEIVGRAMGR